jgi:hypothetical protein
MNEMKSVLRTEMKKGKFKVQQRACKRQPESSLSLSEFCHKVRAVSCTVPNYRTFLAVRTPSFKHLTAKFFEQKRLLGPAAMTAGRRAGMRYKKAGKISEQTWIMLI